MVTMLTKEQKERFVEAYVRNEMDVIFNTMDKEMRMNLFNTEDPEAIKAMLIDSVKDFHTVEDVRNGFDDVYDDAMFDETRYQSEGLKVGDILIAKNGSEFPDKTTKGKEYPVVETYERWDGATVFHIESDDGVVRMPISTIFEKKIV